MQSLKSDIGAKAAWKGFATQTVYIAYRLMILHDNYGFYPEKVEDLMIKDDKSPIELVQIKNLTSSLTLSDLSPKDEDSFFKRSLSTRKENESIILKVISFGEIGNELQGIIDRDKSSTNAIKKKLISYGYKSDEIEWILSNLVIEKVNEDDLKNYIFRILNERIETMIAPNIAFDTLICYISELSRFSGGTSKELWNKKIDDYVKDIASIKGICSQYERTIINLADYKTNISESDLAYQYNMGVNAHPQHIRNNLDIIREDWLDKISQGFINNNVVVIKGASGQGKSSLAYRYLINTYPESSAFIIEKVINDEQAIDIVSALYGLSMSKASSSIIYMDVSPNDKSWIWIVDEIEKRGLKLNILITIREEDYNRSNVDSNIIKSNVIELSFSKEEAKEIFSKYHSKYFTTFDKAWSKFGECGPFMEFIYLLNHTDTLMNKLRSQIQVIENINDSDDWLNILQIICYASMENYKVNLPNLLNQVNCKNQRRMLKEFRDEYLVKVSDDNKYIEGLHALRAKILYEILKEDSIIDEESILIYCLSCVDEFCQPMIVKYIYKNINLDSFINRISNIRFESWTIYASITAALLWLDTYTLYLCDEEVMRKGYEFIPGGFSLFVGDITGNLNFDMFSCIEEIFKEYPDQVKKFKDILLELPQKKISYHYTDIFLNSSKKYLNECYIHQNDDLSMVGYVLFWMGIRKIYIENNIYANVTSNVQDYAMENLLDFLVGIQVQNKTKAYDKICEFIIPNICLKYNIINLLIGERHVEAYFINDIFINEEQENYIKKNEEEDYKTNNKVMKVVDVLRRLFFDKDRYHVKIIGTEIVPNIEVLDTEKNIASSNLPLIWITQLNRWFINMNDYIYREEDWDSFKKEIDSYRLEILKYSKILCEGISVFYKKNGDLSGFRTQKYNETKNHIIDISKKVFSSPKCENDKYGLTIDNNKVVLPRAMSNSNTDSNTSIVYSMRDYTTSYTNFFKNVEKVIKLRYERKELDDSSRLSVINLVDAVSELILLRKKYKLDFYEDKLEDKNEYDTLVILMMLWNYLFKHDLRKESSVLYDIKEEIKDKRRKLKNIFDNLILKYKSNNSIRDSILKDCKLFVYMTIDNVDTFLEDLFIEFKKQFPNIKALEPDTIFLKEFLDEIIIIIMDNNYDIIGGQSVKLNRLIYDDSIENFNRYVMPMDNYEINNYIINNCKFIDSNSIVFHSYKIVGLLYSMGLFYNHTISTMTYIKVNENSIGKQDKVISEWLNRASNLNSEIVQQIISSLNIVKECLDEEYNDKYKILIDCLEKYRDISPYIVSIDSRREIDDVFNPIITSICEILNCTGCIIKF